MAKITKAEAEKLSPVVGISGMERTEIITKIENDLKVTKEAYLPQSKYSIVLSAFTRGELLHLQSLIRREELYREETYKIVYKHIVSTSLGKLTLEEFITNTSFLDLDTIAYLMYSATFKDKGVYRITCLNEKCGNIIDIKLNNSALIKINDQERYESMQMRNLREKVTLDQLRKEDDHFINRETILKLDDSGHIVVLREPSLADDAWTARMSKDERLTEDEGLLTAIECITEMRLVVDKDSNKVLVLKDKSEILEALIKLSHVDQSEIISEAEGILYGGEISYNVEGVKCPHCGEVYEKLPISLSNVLFYSIYTEV